MELTKHCKWCRCSTCKYQGTDNCLHDSEARCFHCDGVKSNTLIYKEKSTDCKGYIKRREEK